MHNAVTVFWPWWLGGAALAAVAVGYAWFLRAPLGVSGMFTRLTGSSGGACSAAEDACGAPSCEAPFSGVTSRGGIGALVFLVAIACGAFVARLVRGEGAAPSLDMGPTFSGLFGSGAGMYLALAVGGVLVGVGTRMAGGCTSGHGLSGVARLQKASVIATAVFFGTGIAVSVLLTRMAS